MRSHDTELTSALAAVTSFQGAVQQADDKIRTLITVLGMQAGFVTAQLGLLARNSQTRVPGLVVLALFAVALVLAGVQLFLALRPNTDGPPGAGNRFAFPSVALHSWPVGGSLRAQCREAREVARLLARLAMVKHRRVRRAMMWTGCAFLSSLVSLVLLVVTG
jgi:hypothetical protein